MTKSTDVPTATFADRLHALGRASLASIPVVGSAAEVLFTEFITPSLEKRRFEWMNDIADRLQKLEERGDLNLEDLQNNESFVTTLMQAGQAAIRDHQSEKLEALRNAVVNAALPHAPEESLQQHFINLIDTFTVWHLRLLDLFSDPQAWFQRNNATLPSASSLEQLIMAAWAELQDHSDFLKVIVDELAAKGLFSSNGEILRTMMTPHGVLGKRTTEMGDSFLKFIKAP